MVADACWVVQLDVSAPPSRAIASGRRSGGRADRVGLLWPGGRPPARSGQRLQQDLLDSMANDLGEYNGTTAQNLHVYSSYTNSSTWQRTSLGYDATDNYAVVRSENSTSGAAPG